MFTEFGKLTRMYRLKHGLILKEMAEKLNVPSSYLSAVEMGRKSITKEFADKILSTYTFTKEEIEQFNDAVEKSANAYKLSVARQNSEKRELAYSFARKFDSLSPEEVKKLMEFLK